MYMQVTGPVPGGELTLGHINKIWIWVLLLKEGSSEHDSNHQNWKQECLGEDDCAL